MLYYCSNTSPVVACSSINININILSWLHLRRRLVLAVVSFLQQWMINTPRTWMGFLAETGNGPRLYNREGGNRMKRHRLQHVSHIRIGLPYDTTALFLFWRVLSSLSVPCFFFNATTHCRMASIMITRQWKKNTTVTSTYNIYKMDTMPQLLWTTQTMPPAVAFLNIPVYQYKVF